MIRQLAAEGFTVFPQRESFSFVPGINVIVGGNDSGKSHLMKLCYALSRWGSGSSRRELPEVWAEEKRLRQNLLRVFGTHDLSALTARNRGNGEARIRASLEGHHVPLGTADLDFTFTAGREEEGLHITRAPQRYLSENAVFISPREVLSIYPCYMQAGKRYPELLDSASWELCSALEDEPGSAPLHGALRHVMQSIEKLLCCMNAEGSPYPRTPPSLLLWDSCTETAMSFQNDTCILKNRSTLQSPPPLSTLERPIRFIACTGTE